MAEIRSESIHAESYEALHESIPGASFIFMNHGYAHLDGRNHLPWLAADDTKYLFNVQLLAQVVEDVDLKGSNVFEVGCGRGGNCATLSRYFAPKSIVGMDYSSSGMRLCKRIHEDSDIRFVRGSASSLPFSDATFDCLINIESSHCYPDVVGFYREVLRVLRPGGTFCYADCLPPSLVPRLARALSLLGFIQQRQVDITANVAHAITLGIAEYRQTLLESCQSAEGVEQAESLVNSIRGSIFENYKSGRTHYWIWQLRKRR